MFIAILYTTAPAIAAFARTNLINTVREKPYSDVPKWFTKWEETGLITFTDKNDDGRIQYVAEEDKNELFIDRDIMVLANPEIARLPNWVIALVAAGGLAAALSTAAGLLLVISTAVSHDLIKKQINPNISERAELMWARLSATVAVIIAGLFGIYPPDYVAAVVALAFGLAAASFFPAIILGIFYKKMNRQGAVTGMIVGLLFTLGYIIYFKFMGGAEDDWFFGISPEGIGTVGMFLNLLVALTINRFTPEPPDEIQQIVEEIRYPRGLKMD